MVLETEQPLTAKDWRGKEIKVGTRIIWSNRTWGIGTVTNISRDSYGEILLSVLWKERGRWDKDKVGKIGHSIRAYNCIVLPIQDEV